MVHIKFPIVNVILVQTSMSKKREETQNSRIEEKLAVENGEHNKARTKQERDENLIMKK